MEDKIEIRMCGKWCRKRHNRGKSQERKGRG